MLFIPLNFLSCLFQLEVEVAVDVLIITAVVTVDDLTDARHDSEESELCEVQKWTGQVVEVTGRGQIRSSLEDVQRV